MTLNENDAAWQFLRLSQEELLKVQSKKYDSKKNVWIPDAEEGFVAGDVESTEGDRVVVLTSKGDSKTLNKDECQEVNPPKFEKTEDMANLTFLNEASVLHNLRQRYYSMLIYVRKPLSVAKPSARGYKDKENQSMLITGESGAGKTENTKKVIAYFANVGATQQASAKKGASLEDQIVQTNPVLEAFGNAKTVRNNNSSRFGKFIRIHFSGSGKLAGGDIEHYLLEKSRVVRQAAGERSYHIFYQLMSGHLKGLRERLLLEGDIRSYRFVSQAEVTIDGVNDAEEMKLTDEAFDVMGFEGSEKEDLYKITGAIMHMGEMKFKQKPREEQAEIDGTAEAELAAKLYGVEPEHFLTALVKPRVKVGTEWVNKGQNLEQVTWAVSALAKANYARMFHWLIKRCNKTLDAQDFQRKHFIGVLDIAGFEIFDFNSFEQLWINFVNEKLQQFFNHHMFVLEQEEYQREGIKWSFIDFGLDLQMCIELIEKPLGVVSLLDEECIVPKASDLTYVQKLNDQHMGKHNNFQKPKPPKGTQGEAHFAIVHYAGTVRYNANAWLEKNKDPLNETVVGVLKSTVENKVLKAMWDDYKTQEDLIKEGPQAGKKKGKAASFMTVSMMYRESLNNLMTMLHQTHPHFIRCIIPNELKKSGVIDAPLVLNQLTCNGVLEGIRICRKGFPNRMYFPDFKHRYAILAAQEATDADETAASAKMLQRMTKDGKLNDEEFKIGHTKIFFKAGILARLEDLRDEALGLAMTKFQASVRGYLAKADYARRKVQMDSIVTIQRNVRAWCTLRTWKWFRLYGNVKPMINQSKKNEEAEKLEALLKETEEALTKERKALQDEKSLNAKLAENNSKLASDLEAESAQRKRLKKESEELADRLQTKEDELAQQLEVKRKLETLCDALRQNAASLEEAAKKLQLEKQNKDRQIQSLQEEMGNQDGLIAKLNQDKKAQESANAQLMERLQQELLRNDKLENVKAKLERALEDSERKLETETKARQDSERAKKKSESEIKSLQDKLDQSHVQKRDLESQLKKRESEFSASKHRVADQDSLILKLQMQIHELQARIDQLEEELEAERRARQRAEKFKAELQNQLDTSNVHLFEANGALSVQLEQNKRNKSVLSKLQSEISERNFSYEKEIVDLQSVQFNTLNKLRDLHTTANDLESEVATILGHFRH